VEEDKISFPSDVHMAKGVEDYAHQIAEMIGLQNEFNFNEAGMSCCHCKMFQPKLFFLAFIFWMHRTETNCISGNKVSLFGAKSNTY
jgi:hypothetical protein